MIISGHSACCTTAPKRQFEVEQSMQCWWYLRWDPGVWLSSASSNFSFFHLPNLEYLMHIQTVEVVNIIPIYKGNQADCRTCKISLLCFALKVLTLILIASFILEKCHKQHHEPYITFCIVFQNQILLHGGWSQVHSGPC